MSVKKVSNSIEVKAEIEEVKKIGGKWKEEGR